MWGVPDPKGSNSSLGFRTDTSSALIREEDVSVLKPNEEFDPLGSGTPHIRQVSAWEPLEVGKHRLNLTFDYSATEPAEWNARPERPVADTEKVRQMLALVPRVKL